MNVCACVRLDTPLHPRRPLSLLPIQHPTRCSFGVLVPGPPRARSVRAGILAVREPLTFAPIHVPTAAYTQTPMSHINHTNTALHTP